MKNLLLMLSLFGFFMFTTSCKDDDGCNIDSLEDQYEDIYDDFFDECTSFDSDCDDCEDAINAYIDFLEGNKGCITTDGDFDEDDIDDEIDYLEDYIDDYLDC